MPWRMLPWPFAISVAAHALYWGALNFLHTGGVEAAGIGCLFAGLVLAPVSRLKRMPFAAIAFAAVVSMIPGVFLFRMASGLMQLASGSHTTFELLSATISDGMTAVSIILAMTLGLLVPKLLIDYLAELRMRPPQQTKG